MTEITGEPDLLVSKEVHSAFYGEPDLHAWLQKHGISGVAVCGIQTNKKRNKARAMFTAYTTGKSLVQSAEAVGVSKATGSAYLNEIEAETGIAFIRGKRRENSIPTPSRGNVSLKRETGLRRASVRDFHALRTTWITLALMNGMPLELVQTLSLP